MSDVERLEAELKMAKALEPLERAREAMHAHRTPKTIAAYKKACTKAAKARQAFREAFPPVASSGTDGTAAPATVRSKAGVDRP